MKHKPISKEKRRHVWLKYNGHCAYCGCELKYEDMQVDHVGSVYYTAYIQGGEQNDELGNLMPSCRMCNFYKQASDIEGLRNKLQDMLMPNVRRPFDYRLALKYGLVQENIHPIKFYFEKSMEEQK